MTATRTGIDLRRHNIEARRKVEERHTLDDKCNKHLSLLFILCVSYCVRTPQRDGKGVGGTVEGVGSGGNGGKKSDCVASITAVRG
jgi:hypothetical protein